MKKQWAIYIMTNGKNGTLYIGRTDDLVRRIWEHKNKVVKGFTERYDLNKLVYYEVWEDGIESIRRERNMKKWKREWKIKLIEKQNPDWNDLYAEVCGSLPSQG